MARSTTEITAQNDTPSARFYASRFMKKEPTTSAVLQLGRLSNEIHPLFDKGRFCTSEEGGIDYRVIEQPARLVNRFLESEEAFAFFKTTLLPEGFWQNPKDQRDWAVQYASRIIPADKNEQGKIQAFLNDVADNTVWTVKDVPGCEAVTDQVGKKDVQLPECPYGHKSIIQISKIKYDALASAHSRGDDVPLLLTLRFEFAVMLTHEVAHAAHNFRFGKLDHEPAFGKAGVAELGFELESCLFGGHLARLYTHVDPAGTETLQVHRHNGKLSDLPGLLVL